LDSPNRRCFALSRRFGLPLSSALYGNGMKKYSYPLTVIMLIVGFNAVMYFGRHGNMKLIILAVILSALIYTILFKNVGLKLIKNKGYLVALGALGPLLVFVNDKISFAYAVVGLLLLSAVQFNVMFTGKPSWFFIGGDPLHKFGERQQLVVNIGLCMLVSVAVTFFIKVLWLANAI
jgi:hypothetical protein